MNWCKVKFNLFCRFSDFKDFSIDHNSRLLEGGLISDSSNSLKSLIELLNDRLSYHNLFSSDNSLILETNLRLFNFNLFLYNSKVLDWNRLDHFYSLICNYSLEFQRHINWSNAFSCDSFNLSEVLNCEVAQDWLDNWNSLSLIDLHSLIVSLNLRLGYFNGLCYSNSLIENCHSRFFDNYSLSKVLDDCWCFDINGRWNDFNCL